MFSKLIVPTHFSMVVCVQTVKDARCKVKIRDELMSQKRSDLQKDYYCSRSNWEESLLSNELLKIMQSFILSLPMNKKLLLCFSTIDIITSNESAINHIQSNFSIG